MRQAGTISDKAAAHRFVAYLIIQGISATSEQDGETWGIWVRDEDLLERARSELAQFVADPGNARYNDAERQALELRRKEDLKNQERQRNVVHPRDHWGTGRITTGPLTKILIGICVLVTLAFWYLPNGEQVFEKLGFCGREDFLLTLGGKHLINHLNRFFLEGAGDQQLPAEDREVELIDIQSELASNRWSLASIQRGEFWRLVTPIFIHLSGMHLVMNMLALHSLGSRIEYRISFLKYLLLVLGIAVVSNLFQALVPREWGGNWQFGGFSGVLFGLTGYIFVKQKFEPALGLRLAPNELIMTGIWFAICVFGPMHIANWAHGMGFVSGAVIGYLPLLFQRK